MSRLLRVCPGKPGAGNPHAGFYLGGEAQGQPRLLPTDHQVIEHEWLVEIEVDLDTREPDVQAVEHR
jgi:hypothetical protein